MLLMEFMDGWMELRKYSNQFTGIKSYLLHAFSWQSSKQYLSNKSRFCTQVSTRRRHIKTVSECCPKCNGAILPWMHLISCETDHPFLSNVIFDSNCMFYETSLISFQ